MIISLSPSRVGMCFEVAGTLLGIVVYTIFFVSLVHNKEEDCNNEDRQPDHEMRATFRYHALTLGVLTFFFILTTFLGVREQQGQLYHPNGSVHIHFVILNFSDPLNPSTLNKFFSPTTLTLHRGNPQGQENWFL